MSKKIIALLVCFLCILSSVTVMAETTENGTAPQVDYSNELSLINAVNPDYILPEDVTHFTRGDFVKLLIDVMCPQTSDESETGFADVDAGSYYAPSLKFARNFGIVSEAENYYPDNNVTYNQAIKMVVTALGYKPLADAKGAYPTGYIAIANNLNLYENLSASGDTDLTVSDGLKLICSVFDCNVMVQTGFGDNQVFDTAPSQSFLYYYHKIKTVYGQVNANEHSTLTDSVNGLGKGYIKIGISDYKVKNDFSKYLGYNVKAYVENNDEIIFMQKHEVNEVVLNTSDIDRVEGFNVISANGNKETKYTLDEAFIYVKNGKAHAITASDFNSYFKFDTGDVTLVDNNRDKRFDVVIARNYSYILVSKVSLGEENVIYDANSSNNSIVIDSEVTYTLTGPEEYDMANMELKEIASGMLLAYTASDDKKLYNIFVCSNTVDGKITELDTGNNRMYINDAIYDISQYYTNYYSHIGLGSEASFLIGIDGKIVACAADGESYMKYGWIVGFSNPSGLEELKLKIFSETGEMLILSLADKVIIDNISHSSASTRSLLEALDDTERLVKFSSNADGELKKVDIYSEAQANEFELTGKNQSDSLVKFSTGNYRYKSGSGIFVASANGTFSFHIEATTVNFVIPDSIADRSDDSKYAVVSTSYFENDQTYSSISSFDVNKTGCAAVTLMFGSSRGGGAGVSNYTGTAVIEKITTGLDPEGENALVVYAWKGNKYGVYYSDPDLSYDYISILNPGDLVRFVADKNNVITDITRDFNAQTFEMASGYDNVAGILEYIPGISYSATDRYMNVITNPKITPTGAQMPESYTIDDIRNISISSTSVVYVDLVKRADGTVVSALPRMSEISGIKSYLDSGDNANFIVARQYILGSQLTVVYNIEVK